jgi:hypothetical protein
MKKVITIAIIISIAIVSCKKEASTDQSNNSDSVSVADNNNMPTNNSSGTPTDSLHTESQNAAMQKTTSSPNSSGNLQSDSTNTGGESK